MLLYAFMATSGSALGCWILYLVSRRAGARALNRFSETKTGASQESNRALRHDGGVGGNAAAAAVSIQIVRGDGGCFSVQSASRS